MGTTTTRNSKRAARRAQLGLGAGLVMLLTSAVGSLATAQIEQADMDRSGAFALGTLTPGTDALTRDLWQGTTRDMVATMLASVPRDYTDAHYLELLRRVTLSPGEGPQDADNALAAAKFLVAAEAGFYRDAASLAGIVPGLRSEPGLAKVVAYAELFDGELNQACARGAGLRDGRTDPFWIKLRFVCYVRTQEQAAAELTLDLLRRQGSLTPDEDEMFSALVSGAGVANNRLPTDPLSYAVHREAGQMVASVEALAAAHPTVLAAIARDETQAPDVREVALVRSLALKTIGYREGRSLVEQMPAGQLAADLLAVAAQTNGTLEHAEAIGAVLKATRDNWDGFSARALLLSQELPNTEPVINFAPAAEEIALAAMITGQDAVVEKWVLALAGNEANPTQAARAGELVQLYAHLKPGAARRLGSYLNFTFTPPSIPPHMTPVESGSVDLARFVNMGLAAADAGSEGPSALLFLTGQDVAVDTATEAVRDTVLSWARARADLEWLDREAAFKAEAQGLLAREANAGPANGVNGFPVPRVKPASQ